MVKAVVSLNLCFHTYNCWCLGKKSCLCWPGGAPASCSSFFSGIVVPLMSCCLPVLILFFQGQGMLPYFANFRLLAEFSTPCVNQRYVLACLWPVFQVSLGLFFIYIFTLVISKWNASQVTATEYPTFSTFASSFSLYLGLSYGWLCV